MPQVKPSDFNDTLYWAYLLNSLIWVRVVEWFWGSECLLKCAKWHHLPLTFFEIEAGYYHTEEICCLPESSLFCPMQIPLKSTCKLVKVKILPTHLWYDNYTLSSVMRLSLWYVLLGFCTSQISQHHCQIPSRKGFWKHCQSLSDFCKGKSYEVFSWHDFSLCVSTYLQ